ncbi:sulfotransferase family protein [Hyphococcus sp.]|uniref:sulfotransferase family protein n=1 Tax=Hyphococcus sp. TaxID=2038636 RepID=UPI0035C78926
MSDRPAKPESSNRPGSGLVFAGGCPRSGLTLLRRLLARHPEILAGPDTGAAPAIAFQWRNYAQSLGGLHEKYFDLKPDYVADTMGRFLEGLLRAEREQRTIVEKTSLNVVAFEALSVILPAAKFIHVVRDGRDVTASLLERNWRDPSTGQPFPHVSDRMAAIQYWSGLVAAGLDAEKKLGPRGRIFRVRYEDLAARPESAAKAICEFLDLDWPAAKDLKPPLANDDYLGLERDSLPLMLGPVTASRIGRHRRVMPADIVRQLEDAGRPTLAALGYL